MDKIFVHNYKLSIVLSKIFFLHNGSLPVLGTNMPDSCVPSNFMANRRVPKFFLNNCAQSSKKTFMCPKFCTNPVLKYTKCHISTNLSNFLKLCLLYCQKLFALAPTNHRFAEKIGLAGTLPDRIWKLLYSWSFRVIESLLVIKLLFNPGSKSWLRRESHFWTWQCNYFELITSFLHNTFWLASSYHMPFQNRLSSAKIN